MGSFFWETIILFAFPLDGVEYPFFREEVSRLLRAERGAYQPDPSKKDQSPAGAAKSVQGAESICLGLRV